MTTDLTAQGAFGKRRPPADGDKSLLAASDLSPAGLQGVLLVGQQVVVHGVHQQAVTLRVLHHTGHCLDLAHQLARRDCLQAHVRQQRRGVWLTGCLEIQPLHGHLEKCEKCVMYSFGSLFPSCRHTVFTKGFTEKMKMETMTIHNLA